MTPSALFLHDFAPGNFNATDHGNFSYEPIPFVGVAFAFKSDTGSFYRQALVFKDGAPMADVGRDLIRLGQLFLTPDERLVVDEDLLTGCELNATPEYLAAIKDRKPIPPVDHITAEVMALKALRRDLDAVLQRIKAMPFTMERDEARVRATDAVMWLGMDMKRINDANPSAAPDPYPSSKDPSTGAKIEPTADGLVL